jgi:hypothetical protein
MERQKFNEDLKKAFDQAEISPTENVWVNIELDLEKAKGSQLRKRLVFYQLLAAASVVFSIGVGVSVYLLNDNTFVAPPTLSHQSVQLPAIEKTEPAAATVNKNESIASANESITSGNESTSSVNESIASVKEESMSVNTENSSDSNAWRGKNNVLRSKNTESGKPSLADIVKTSSVNGHTGKETSATSNSRTPTPDEASLLASRENSVGEKYMNLTETNSGLPALVRMEKIELQVGLPQKETTTADPVVLMLARLEQREKEVKEAKEDKKELSEKLWTSVGFAAGSFNATNAGVSSPSSTSAFAMNKPIADQEAKAPGITYSVGVNMGTKLSERWVFQGGVSYLTQSSDYTANTAVAALQSDNSTKFRAQSINELDRLDENSTEELSQIVPTAPYNVNNNIKYLSIPLQAGYLIVNRAFGLQLNAGISTDLFLQNTLTPESPNLDKTTQGLGEDSPYRAVNLSGLMGTEVSYRFGQHYRIALNPGIRYPFNSIYRSELGVKSTPLSFDVGVRFRYIFH